MKREKNTFEGALGLSGFGLTECLVNTVSKLLKLVITLLLGTLIPYIKV